MRVLRMIRSPHFALGALWLIVASLEAELHRASWVVGVTYMLAACGFLEAWAAAKPVEQQAA